MLYLKSQWSESAKYENINVKLKYFFVSFVSIVKRSGSKKWQSVKS